MGLFCETKLVRMIGIEPTWVTPLDPKSSASASFATSANGLDRVAKVGVLHIKFAPRLSLFNR
jgi:hypothetical protein